jgi:hypothetical protein
MRAMNGKKRVALAMQHRTPDRVPVMCQLALGHYFLNLAERYTPAEIWFSSDAFADALVTLAQRYRFDGVLINLPGRLPDWQRDIRRMERTDAGELLHWRCGWSTLVPPDDSPIFEPDEPDAAPPPAFSDFDPDRDLARLAAFPRYAWGVYHVPQVADVPPGLLSSVPDYFLRTIRLVQRTGGEALSVHGEVFSPFTHLLELFGYEHALLALATDAAKCVSILDRLTDASIAWGLAQAAAGVDALLISSAFAGAGFISPAMYRAFVLPFERRVVDAVHAAHPATPVYTHTCGRLTDRLELLAETHTDGVDTLDPPPLGDVELADAKRRIGGRLFIKGNLDSVALLADDEAGVRQRARAALRAGMAGGGYILSTACSVAPRVEPWKLMMLADIAEEHGRY